MSPSAASIVSRATPLLVSSLTRARSPFGRKRERCSTQYLAKSRSSTYRCARSLSMAPSIASSSYRLPCKWRRISATLRGRFARNCTAASYGLPRSFGRELAFLTVRAFVTGCQAAPAHFRVDLGHAEGRSDLVLYDLDLDAAADDHVALLDRLDGSDVDAHGRVELERAPPASCFGIPEKNANLLAQLVDEDHGGLRLGDRPGELAQRLAHEPRL